MDLFTQTPSEKNEKQKRASDRSLVRSHRFPSNKIRARAIAGLFLPWPDSSSCPRNNFSGVHISSSSSSSSGRRYPYPARGIPARLSFSRQLRCKNVIKGVRERERAHNESGWRPAARPLRVNDARRPRRCNVCAVARCMRVHRRERASIVTRAFFYERFLLTER